MTYTRYIIVVWLGRAEDGTPHWGIPNKECGGGCDPGPYRFESDAKRVLEAHEDKERLRIVRCSLPEGL